MKIFLVTSIHPDCVSDILQDDLVDDLLDPGVAFATLEQAQASVQLEVNDLGEDEDTPIQIDFPKSWIQNNDDWTLDLEDLDFAARITRAEI